MKFLKLIFVILCFTFLFYLSLPSPDFPQPPPDSIQSHEPADSETPLRRAYFTNYTRAQVLEWYESQLRTSSFLNLKMPTYRLNYGPEESQLIIRDQTRSTFLEEIVHPFRESVYVNGFEPTDPKDVIFIEGKNWRQKIIIRYVPSALVVRLLSFVGIVASVIILFRGWKAVR